MIIEIKVPSPGESITEVELATWLVKDGENVSADEEIAEIDSDKATIAVHSEVAGILHITVQAGTTIKVGSVIGTIEAIEGVVAITTTPQPKEKPVIAKPAVKVPSNLNITPLAKKIMESNNIKPSAISNMAKDKKIKKEDILNFSNPKPETTAKIYGDGRPVEVIKMSSLRKKISERLVAAKNQTAMLTTFNEVDMSGINEIREKYKEAFLQKHGVKLGFMSFFARACQLAAAEFPGTNAMIDNESIVFFKYMDLAIAVSTSKGLMTPVIRDVQELSFAGIEKKLAELAAKARDNRISLEDLTGGTFTITNGGVFGSLMSTPILNPPQSAILGMHKIMDRAMVIDGKVEVRPMMYIALSYDHRIIDGKESVGFIVKVKELLEKPAELFFNNEVEKMLLESDK
jgi:2-oxoglutarate dehydrogenase E2 component (dihydrolipoamide succinyltransferase)